MTVSSLPDIGCAGGGSELCLQFGQEGDDLHSMTRRWQFTHTAATMLPDEEDLVGFSGLAEVVLFSELAKVAMLSSRSSFCSLGLLQLFLKVFLFKK